MYLFFSQKINFAMQQHSKKIETEKHTLEMDKRLWLIEQDCLKEQLRSLKRDMERCQQENVSLRHSLAAMNNETSLSTCQESLQGLSPQELRTEVAVLRHQVRLDWKYYFKFCYVCELIISFGFNSLLCVLCICWVTLAENVGVYLLVKEIL